MTTKVILLLGGIRGADGYVDSAGMLRVQALLKPHGIEPAVHTWDRYRDAEPEIRYALADGQKVAIVGYSGGGSRATDLVREMPNAHIDLVVGYDPSPAWETYPLTATVAKALCFHNKMRDLIIPLVGQLGGGQYVALPGHSHPTIETVEINQPHLSVQANEELHARTVKEILAL